MIQMLTLLMLPMLSATQAPEAYLFAHMTHKDYGRLYYSVSLNGRHWTFLNDGKRVTDDYQGHPDICQGHDGRYYLIGNQSTAEHIILWVSDDLITWKRHTQFHPNLNKTPGFKPGFHYAGAPKIFYDTPSKAYLISWHTPSQKNDKKNPALMWDSMRTLYVTSQDLATFSDPKRLFGFDIATIDVIIKHIDGEYVAFLKDERDPKFDWPTGKTIRVSVADKLLGPYGEPSQPISPNWREAPTVIPRPDGEGWYMYCEQYPGLSYDCFTARHLDGSWFGLHAHRSTTPPQARHGSMLPITRKQYDAIMKAFPNSPVTKREGKSKK